MQEPCTCGIFVGFALDGAVCTSGQGCEASRLKYTFRDLTVEELKNVNRFFPHFRYSMDTYVFKDSSQKDLLNFTGTIPVMYQGNTYNIPIRLWILDSHPFAPPICFLKPTANMGISVGKHVDAQGRIYLPYLQNWSHPKSVIVGLIKEMIAKFQEELPLYSLSSSDEARQVDLLAYIAKITEGVSDINAKNWVNHEHKTVNKITVVGGGELGIACTLAISAKVVIFTVNSLGSSQSYLDVVQSNVDMFRALVPALGHYSQHGVLLVASQPVEIMTYVTWKLSAFPANRVIGIGCNLDSQRLQYIITNVLKAQTSGKQVWVVGEQGEAKVPIWGGQEEVMSHNSQVQLSTRAMELLRVKGQRSWSVGLSVADLVDSIVNDKKKVHSVSTLAKGYYDINNEVFLSLPCIVGTSGVSEVIKNTVKEDTVTEKLQSSSSSIHDLQQQLKL
ncbi:ubiquitin-conjugating enzyme E2 variant 3 isoform X4 [Canis lupus familiaris]|uniref:ubiquitin-conjugating enzyme E2 variant 3 isoform X4 n=1 Tax=Canis lupus familiaris TaxID=9615 RepID=UPI0003ADEF09|nr:ubiquitin-conjugating enzyme E2 variant 3 isoform X4 [Canis lupus familiaris]XP_025315494.1 ubiquitin-conjugating enzyme E2 variant 3 isoform X5 [Canis lupus dingo]|eukprot:XP_005633794.1 ubiquitin-conjugating enzyme E2 variant 3 isoform X3 [Canis lupus familiaris]